MDRAERNRLEWLQAEVKRVDAARAEVAARLAELDVQLREAEQLETQAQLEVTRLASQVAEAKRELMQHVDLGTDLRGANALAVQGRATKVLSWMLVAAAVGWGFMITCRR